MQPSWGASHTPNWHQRENRLNTVFHLPCALGNSRHCAPLRNIHSTALRKARHYSYPQKLLGLPQGLANTKPCGSWNLPTWQN